MADRVWQRQTHFGWHAFWTSLTFLQKLSNCCYGQTRRDSSFVATFTYTNHSPTALFLNQVFNKCNKYTVWLLLNICLTISKVPPTSSSISVSGECGKNLYYFTRFFVSLMFLFDFSVLSRPLYASFLLFFFFLLPAVPEHSNQVPKNTFYLKCHVKQD